MHAIDKTDIPEALRTPKQIEAQYGLRAATLRKWTREGVLPCYRIRGLILLDPREVLAALERVEGRRTA